MKKGIALIVLITVIMGLESCHVGASGGWKNDSIDPKVRQEVKQLNDKLFKALVNNDIPGVKSLASDVLVSKAGLRLDTLVMQSAAFLKGADYTTLDDFYTKNTTDNVSNTLFSRLGKDDFTINYLALNKDMFASVMITKNLPVNFLILAIYGKYETGWKLNILHLGEYNVFGKTAPEYTSEAAENYKKGYLINAANDIITASQLIKPGGDEIKYKNEDEMKNLYQKIITEANTTYHFPIKVNNVVKQPQIFGINPQTLSNSAYKGVYPVINYLTSISLKDTVALKEQNDELQKAVITIFKGIDQQKVILYQATDLFPNAVSKAPANYHRFIQKLK